MSIVGIGGRRHFVKHLPCIIFEVGLFCNSTITVMLNSYLGGLNCLNRASLNRINFG